MASPDQIAPAALPARHFVVFGRNVQALDPEVAPLGDARDHPIVFPPRLGQRDRVDGRLQRPLRGMRMERPCRLATRWRRGGADPHRTAAGRRAALSAQLLRAARPNWQARHSPSSLDTAANVRFRVRNRACDSGEPSYPPIPEPSRLIASGRSRPQGERFWSCAPDTGARPAFMPSREARRIR